MFSLVASLFYARVFGPLPAKWNDVLDKSLAVKFLIILAVAMVSFRPLNGEKLIWILGADVLIVYIWS